MEQHIKSVINYFLYFKYVPSFNEIHVFFPITISRTKLAQTLRTYIKEKKIIRLPLPASNTSIFHGLYTLPQYSITQRIYTTRTCRAKNTNRLLQKSKSYIRLLSFIPTVKMITVTGSASMNNCKSNDDLDLCIVSERHCLWRTRFLCIVIAKWMKIYGSTVCLNLFFDEENLSIPLVKQTPYVAHEILQTKPVFEKNQLYKRFLSKNAWIYRYFPNAQTYTKPISWTYKQEKIISRILIRLLYTGSLLVPQWILRFIQLFFIRKNRTGKIIHSGQLWLFIHDFETRIKRAKI